MYTIKNIKDICDARLKASQYSKEVALDFINEAIQEIYNTDDWWFARRNLQITLNSAEADSEGLLQIILPEDFGKLGYIQETNDYLVQPQVIDFNKGEAMYYSPNTYLNLSYCWFKDTTALMYKKYSSTANKFILFSGNLGTVSKTGINGAVNLSGRYNNYIVNETLTLSSGRAISTNYFDRIDTAYKKTASNYTMSLADASTSYTVAYNGATKEFTFDSVTSLKVGDTFVLDDATHEIGYCPLTVATITTATKVVTVKEASSLSGANITATTAYNVVLTLDTNRDNFEAVNIYFYPVDADTSVNLVYYKKPKQYIAEEEILDFPSEFVLTVLVNFIVKKCAVFDEKGQLYQESNSSYQKGIVQMQKRNNEDNAEIIKFQSDVNMGNYSAGFLTNPRYENGYYQHKPITV